MPVYDVEVWYETHEGPGMAQFGGAYQTPELAAFAAGLSFGKNFPQVAQVRHVVIRDPSADRVRLVAHGHDHAHGHGDDDSEDTDPAEDVPGLLDASGAVPDPNTPNRVEDDPWWQAHGTVLRGPHPAISGENVINHDTVREQTGENA